MRHGNTLEIRKVAGNDTDTLVMMENRQQDVGKHDHLFFELAYITAGEAEHTLNETRNVLHAGDYFFIDFGSSHCYENSRDLTLINCLFLPEVIDETLRDCRSLNELLQACLIRYSRVIVSKNWADRIFHDEDGRVGSLMRGMVEEYRDPQMGSPEIFRCKLTEILILTLRKLVQNETPYAASGTVEKVIRFAERRYPESITLQDFCAAEHYSLSYISRRFKQETGITFRTYLQRLRIEKSCELLGGGEQSVSEIARAVGYEDMQSFHAAFRRYLHMTPREYRKIGRKQNIVG